MRKFTKLMLALAMFVGGVISANAQDEEVELTQDMYLEWNGFGADATQVGKGYIEYHVGEKVNAGATVYGDGSVNGKHYADLTGCLKIIFEGKEGVNLRVLFNRQSMDGSSSDYVEKTTKIVDGKAEMDLAALPYVHLNVIKIPWDESTENEISSIKVVRPSDPLAVPKEALKKAIASAKLQNSVAKTPESFEKLTKAIEEAQNVLDTATTAEELAAATKSVNEAIEGLELATGYTNLTKGMYNNNDCAYVMNESTGMPYGDSNVAMGNYADLSGYDKLIIAVSTGTPRFCINRTTAAGQDNADENLSEMIDIPGQAWGTNRYQTVSEDSKVFTIDLTKIVEEKGKAYLHCIKGANYGQVTIIGMYLYREATTVTLDKQNGTGYCTFASRYPTTWPVDGITAYKAMVKNGEVSFDEVKGDVPSNTGLLLKAEDAKYTINIPETVPAAVEDNALVGVLKDTAIEKEGIFVLYKKDENVGFYKTTASTFTVGANTAYLPAQEVAAARTFIALPGNETTGVKAIEAAEADGKFFDLQGRQVSKPTKGLYINNGKKYIVK